MAVYRFFRLNAGKRLSAPGEDHEFVDDLQALEHAKGLANGHAVGVWQGARFVANVESSDAAAHQGQFTAHRAS